METEYDGTKFNCMKRHLFLVGTGFIISTLEARIANKHLNVTIIQSPTHRTDNEFILEKPHAAFAFVPYVGNDIEFNILEQQTYVQSFEQPVSCPCSHCAHKKVPKPKARSPGPFLFLEL
jgi:hypothetical protein